MEILKTTEPMKHDKRFYIWNQIGKELGVKLTHRVMDTMTSYGPGMDAVSVVATECGNLVVYADGKSNQDGNDYIHASLVTPDFDWTVNTDYERFCSEAHYERLCKQAGIIYGAYAIREELMYDPQEEHSRPRFW